MSLSRLAAVVACLMLLVAALLAPLPVSACPFCSAPSLTLTEQLAGADATVLVKWTGGKEIGRAHV